MRRVQRPEIILLTWLTSCSLSTIEQVNCSSDLSCRTEFGYGHYCADDGFCATVDLPSRCDVYPATLSLPLDTDQFVLYATLFNHGSETHLARVQSARLAAMQANENGGLDARQFAILECTIEENATYDNLSQEEAVIELSLALAEDIGVPAIVGPASSTDVEAAYNAIGGSRTTVLISPSATSPTLTDLDGITASDDSPGLLWRTATPDSVQGSVIASDMSARNVASVAVIHQTGAYGDALAQLFATNFGGVVTLLPYSDGTSRELAIASGGESEVDEVLFISSEVDDVVAFLLSASADNNYDLKSIFLTDSAATVQVLNDASAAAGLFDRVRGTKPSIPSGNLYDTFVANYRAEFGGQDASTFSFTAHSYDASWLVIYGAAWAVSQGDLNSGEDFARGFRQLSDGAAAEIRPTTWNTIKASFSAGTSLDVVGTSGALDFDPATEETTAPVEVWTIDADGTAIIVDYVSE